jgi:phage shock protein A
MSKKNKKTAKPAEEIVVENEKQVTDTTVVEEVVTEPTEEPVLEVKDEEELLNEFTSPENIENLEKELNEEYANTQGKEEEAPEDLIDLGVAQEVIDKFGDVNQRLNDIVNNTKPDDLQETLQEELNQASTIEDKLKKRIDELEKKIPPKTRSNLNARMTNLWCGVRYT